MSPINPRYAESQTYVSDCQHIYSTCSVGKNGNPSIGIILFRFCLICLCFFLLKENKTDGIKHIPNKIIYQTNKQKTNNSKSWDQKIRKKNAMFCVGIGPPPLLPWRRLRAAFAAGEEAAPLEKFDGRLIGDEFPMRLLHLFGRFILVKISYRLLKVFHMIHVWVFHIHFWVFHV